MDFRNLVVVVVVFRRGAGDFHGLGFFTRSGSTQTRPDHSSFSASSSFSVSLLLLLLHSLFLPTLLFSFLFSLPYVVFLFVLPFLEK